MSDIILIPIVAGLGFIAGMAAMWRIVNQAFDEYDAAPTYTTTTTYSATDRRGFLNGHRDPSLADPTEHSDHTEEA